MVARQRVQQRGRLGIERQVGILAERRGLRAGEAASSSPQSRTATTGPASRANPAQRPGAVARLRPGSDPTRALPKPHRPCSSPPRNWLSPWAAPGGLLIDTAGLTPVFVTSGTITIAAALIAAAARHGIGSRRG
jgi:hypothetical protein